MICCDSSKAQNKADIEVSYEAHHPNLRNSKDDLQANILLANSDEPKFYSPKTEYVDLLNSIPDGKAKLNEMTRNAYLGKFGRYSLLRLTKFGDILELKIRKVFEFNFHSQERPFGWIKRIKKTFQHKIRVKFKLS